MTRNLAISLQDYEIKILNLTFLGNEKRKTKPNEDYTYKKKKEKKKKKNLLQDGQQKLQKSRYPFRRNSQQ